MGFTLSLVTCNLSDAFRIQVNPFTGEQVRAPVDAGLTETETKALLDVLADFGASPPDDDGYRYVHFDSNHYIGIDVGSSDHVPKHGFALNVEGVLDDAVAGAIWRIAVAGNLCISSSITSGVDALTRTYADPRIAARWPSASILRSSFELKTWLETQLRNQAIV